MSILFSADGVGKQYVLRRNTSMALGLLPGRRPSKFWALQGLHLEVEAGEVVAAIGRNGAGKSTLLKLAAGVTAPTVGTIQRPAAIAPLIEVGAGFHPDLTGRENVYINARLLGVPAKQVRARFDDIVGFAELEHAIDQPVRQYSSGMFMRLGFSVAVHTQPDLLVVDEVLAVGDLPFQVRCLDRIRAMRDAGAGVLFVSHNLTAVLSLADRAVLLDKGQVLSEGAPRDVVADYHGLLARTGAGSDTELGDDSPPTGELVISSVAVTDHAGQSVDLWEPGQEARVRVGVQSPSGVSGGIVGLRLSKEGSGMVGAWHEPGRGSVPPIPPGGGACLEIRLDLNVTSGGYLLDVAIARPDWSAVTAVRSGAYRFGVAPRDGAAGLVDLAPRLRVLGAELL